MSRPKNATSVLDYCMNLMRANAEALGFISVAALERRLHVGALLTVHENDDLCGYAALGRDAYWLQIHQCVVQRDARMLQHGRELVTQALCQAIQRHACGLTLRCRDGLPSNAFWAALGFTRMARVQGGRKRGRQLNVYYLPLPPEFRDPSTDFSRAYQHLDDANRLLGPTQS
jgi:hypothetical protein